MRTKVGFWTVLATMGTFAITAQLYAVSPTFADDMALVEKLVSGSPWKGSWDSGQYKGTPEIVFALNDGQLIGAIQNGTGAPRSFDGPLSYFAIESGVVKFQNRVTGGNYELSLDEGGALKGHSQIRFGGRATIMLTPSRQ